MKSRHYFLALTGCLLTLGLFAQPTPAPEQSASVLVLGGTAHLGTGDVLNDAAIGFRNGLIDFVGFAQEVDRAESMFIQDSLRPTRRWGCRKLELFGPREMIKRPEHSSRTCAR
jgi:hypothetical protein